MGFKVEDLMLSISIVSEERVQFGLAGVCEDGSATLQVDLVSCGPTNPPKPPRVFAPLPANQVACTMGVQDNFADLVTNLRKVLERMENIQKIVEGGGSGNPSRESPAL